MKLIKLNTKKLVGRREKFKLYQGKSPSSQTLTLALLIIGLSFVVLSPEVLALDADGEMGASARRIDTLINRNVMHVVMGVGIASSVIYSFYKSSFVPVGVGVGSGVLYGFAKTWIDAVFAICV